MPKNKKSKDKKPKKSKKSKKKRPAAERADKHALYLNSVQSPENEIDFFEMAWADAFGKGTKPLVLREDFCGTFAVCCEWVKSKRNRTAFGVDIDPEPLDWGREKLLTKLEPAQQERITLWQDDVRAVRDEKADVLAAQNFSFWCFKTREGVLEYFKAAHANIADRGIMVLDMMGGAEVMEEDHEDITDFGKYDYIWEQVRINPITHDALFHIHFRFTDGSAIEPAFTYDWRLWSIPEVTELLTEAGFSEVHVYWEGTDEKTGEGNDIFTRQTDVPADPAWVCYMVAVK